MKTNALMDQIKLPETVEEVLELARVGSGIKVGIQPRIDRNQAEPERHYPSFRLVSEFTVQVGTRTTTFEKTYAKGHEVFPAKSAANGFLIANTRMQRDAKRLRQAGVRCEGSPFILSQLLPDLDLSEFEPRKPYYLNQFAILASIGVPVKIELTTFTRNAALSNGQPGQELCAAYAIQCQGKEYRIESHHGRFPQDADKETVARLRDEAQRYLQTEDLHNLRRVGVEIQMGPLWADAKDSRLSLAAVNHGPGDKEGKIAGRRASLGAA